MTNLLHTLYKKLQCIPSIYANTNLQAAFDLILKTTTDNRLTQADLPSSLIVITDMEFDEGTTCNGNWTFYESMKKHSKQQGYTIPNIIFWNVNSRNDYYQVTSNYQGVQLASGQSPSVFKSILKGTSCTPYELMVEVLNNPIYDCITI